MISVVDERTIGPVTRSRLTLEIPREGGPPIEVITRVAFPTPAARGASRWAEPFPSVTTVTIPPASSSTCPPTDLLSD